jgi:hypothetical protein
VRVSSVRVFVPSAVGVTEEERVQVIAEDYCACSRSLLEEIKGVLVTIKLDDGAEGAEDESGVGQHEGMFRHSGRSSRAPALLGLGAPTKVRSVLLFPVRRWWE